jgi:hypothetical protein
MWMSYVVVDNFKDVVHRWVFHVKKKEARNPSLIKIATTRQDLEQMYKNV